MKFPNALRYILKFLLYLQILDVTAAPSTNIVAIRILPYNIDNSSSDTKLPIDDKPLSLFK